MKFITTAILSIIAAASTNAAVLVTLTENLNSGPQFRTSTLSPVLDGKLVRIGTFAVAPTAAQTFSQLSALFLEFGTTTIGNVTATLADDNLGRISRSSIAGTSGNDASFVGAKIYIWVYNAATADTVADQGIYSSSDTVTPVVFGPGPASTSVSMLKMDQAFGKFIPGTAATTTVVLGSSSGGFLTLGAAVPEPSAIMLSSLAALTLLRRRRLC